MSLNRHTSSLRKFNKSNKRPSGTVHSAVNYGQLEDRRLLAVDIGWSVTSGNFGGSPDQTGGVGPAHIVEVANGAFKVYDKATGQELVNKPLDTFWTDTTEGAAVGAAALPANVANANNARVLYDAHSRRWFITSTSTADLLTAIPGTQSGTLFAVSRTSNPLQDWQSTLWTYDKDSNPMTPPVTEAFGFISSGASPFWTNLSVDADNVYVSVSDRPFGSTETWIFDKAGTLVVPTPNANFVSNIVGAQSMGTHVNMDVTGTAAGTFTLNTDDTTGGAGVNNSIRLTEVINRATAPDLGPTVAVAVDPYRSPPQFVRQEFDPDLVNAGAGLRSEVVRLGNSLWATHAILGASGTTSAIRWYEIDLDTKTIKQSGTIQDDFDNYIYPSIAVTSLGHVAISYTATGIGPTPGTGLFPTAAVSIGYNINGVMTFEDPVFIKDGEAGYFDAIGNFWGAYMTTVADPSDPTKIFVFNEWSTTQTTRSNGRLQISELTLVGHSPTILAPVANVDNVIIVRRSALDPNEIEVEIDGVVVAAYQASVMYSITVDGNGGNDTFILDTVNGEVVLPRGVEFLGDGNDTVRLDSPLRSNWDVERDGTGVVAVGTTLDPDCDQQAVEQVTFQLNFEPGSGWFDTTPWNQGGYATYGDALRGELQKYFDDVIAPVFAGTFTVSVDINDDETDSFASARALGIGFEDIGGQQLLVGSPWSILTGRGDRNGATADGVIDYNLDLALYGNNRQALLDNIAGGLTRHEFFHVLGMESNIPNETTTFDPRGSIINATVMDVNYFDINNAPLIGNYNAGAMTFEVLPYVTNADWAGDGAGLYFMGIADDGSPMPLLVNSNTEQIDFRHLASSFAGTGRNGPWEDVVEQDRAFLRGLGYNLNPVNPPIPLEGNAVFFSGMDEILGGTGVDNFCIRSVNFDLTVRGNTGNDNFAVLGVGVGAIDLFGEAGDDYYEINTSSASVITVSDSLMAENDRMLVLGTASSDLFVFENNGVDINAGRLVYAGIEDINFNSQGGDDTFEITAANIGTVKLDGGADNDQFIVNDGGAGANANKLTVSKVNTTTDQLKLDIETVITDTYLADSIETLSVQGTYVIDGVNGTPTVAGGLHLLGDGNENLILNSSLAAQWLINGDGSGTVTQDVDPMTFMGLMSIDASHGNDTFDIQNTNTDLVIRGREGDDEFSITNAGTGFLTIEGNGDNDTFNVFNSGGGVNLMGNAGLDTFLFDDAGTGLAMLMGGDDNDLFTVLNSGIAGLDIWGDAGVDTFDINNAAGTAPMTVKGGTGDDLFNVIDSGLGSLELRGEVGDDTYTVTFVDPTIMFSIIDSVNAENDTLVAGGSNNADTFDITDISAIVNGGTWSIIGVENFEYDGLAGDDTFNVNMPDTWNGNLVIHGGDDNDSIIINNSGAGNIDLFGDLGDDYYEVHFSPTTDVSITDSIGGEADSFLGLGTNNPDLFALTMDAANVNGGMLSIVGVETVEYDGLAASDVFDVTSAIGDSTFTGNTGADTFNVFSTSDGNHYVGNDGMDIFNVINSSGVTTFEGGNDNDTFNVMMTTGGGTFLGDAGNDIFNIESSTGLSTYRGGTGVDVFTVTDLLPLGSAGLIDIDGGSDRNQLLVNGYQTQANDVTVTSSSITGMSAVPINYAATGGSFSINGSNGGIRLIGSDTENDKFNVVSFSANNSLLMFGGGGDDEFTVLEPALGAIEADGQEGTDTYRYTLGFNNSRFLFAKDTGVAGTDRLVATLTNGNDSVNLSGEVFTVATDTLVFNKNFESLIMDLLAGDDVVNIGRMDVGFLRILGRTGSDRINVNDFTGIRGGVLLETGDGDDTVDIRSTNVGNFVQAYTGNGNDTIIVASSSYGNSIVDGQEGSDTYDVQIADRSSRFVVARDSGTTGFDILSIQGTVLDDLLTLRSGVVRTPNQMVLYNHKTEVLNLNTGAGRDNVSVYGISAATTNINTEADRDLLFLNSTFGNQPSKTLNIDMGVGNDSVVVKGTNADTVSNIDGGAGDDLFNIGSSLVDNNGNLDVLYGRVNVSGGLGTDQIYMNDRGKISSFDYRVTANTVRKITSDPNPFFAGVDYDSVETFRLDTTDYKNRVEVVGSVSTSYRFVGNLGFNQIFLDPFDAAVDGRQLFKTSALDGFWTFTNGKRDIFFENFFVI